MILVSVLQVIADMVDTNSLLFGVLSIAGNPALLSILGSHLLFSMKEAGEKGLNQGTSCGSRSTVSDIDFAEPPPVATSDSQSGAANLETIESEENC